MLISLAALVARGRTVNLKMGMNLKTKADEPVKLVISRLIL